MHTRNIVAAVLASILAAPLASATTLTVGLDVSASAPLLSSGIYADLAAKRAERAINALALGDEVVLQTFGERKLGNLKTLRVQLTRRNRPAAVAAAIAAIIRKLPAAGIEGQAWTNIVSFLEFGSFGCEAGGKVLLITDGVESSEILNERLLLAGQAALPAATAGTLNGCSVTMFGLGAAAGGALPIAQIRTLRGAWEAWMTAAGAKFKPVILQ